MTEAITLKIEMNRKDVVQAMVLLTGDPTCVEKIDELFEEPVSINDFHRKIQPSETERLKINMTMAAMFFDRWQDMTMPPPKKSLFQQRMENIKADYHNKKGRKLCQHDRSVTNRICDDCGSLITYVPDDELA